MTTRKQVKVTDLQLERLALGELSPAEKAEVLFALEEEAGGPERLAALEASDREILEAYPPRAMAAAIDERAAMSARPRKSARVAWTSLAASAAAAALAVGLYFGVTRSFEDTSADARPGYVAVKGEHLRIFKKTSRGHEPISDGYAAKSGDLLQIKYQSDGRSHGVIFSVDGRKATTLHFPDSPGAPTALSKSGFEALGSAYELDDAPAFERFFFVVSDDPIDVAAVLKAAEEMPVDEAAKPVLPSGVDLLEDIVLRKPAKR